VDTVRSDATFLNIGHRGARAFAPENTLPAIRLARRTGANAVELDVRITRDGELVVFHDDNLTRSSDAVNRFPTCPDYRVSAWTLQELSALDAGSWYVHQLRMPAPERQPYLQSLTRDEADGWISSDDAEQYLSGTVRIPSLRDALAEARSCGLSLVLDVKNIPRRDSRIGLRTLALVREMGLAHQTLVTSFDHVLLADIRRADPEIATGVLTADRLPNPVEYVTGLGADAFEPERDVTDAPAIRQLRASGLLVNVWTENDESRMRVLIEAGASGIFTDYPNRLTRALESLGRAAAPAPPFRRSSRREATFDHEKGGNVRD
jgi:glycerophosphoryl diester phosphodiesterase